ncbi:MAG: 30S ribosomal protein S1 [Chloroflexi bacterium]|nr:30S ribosomal protein S1 [Chloroflexota bacterium]
MSELLEEAQDARRIHRGEHVQGTIAQITPDGLLVHIGMKTEGIVPQREMRTLTPSALASLKPGDAVTVTVLRSESESGQVLLSYDKARTEQGRKLLEAALQNGVILEGEVTGYNKGGAIVLVEGIQGFVPLSQLVSAKNTAAGGNGVDLASLVGGKLKMKVIELDAKRDRAILSERAAIQEWKQQQKERLISALAEGQTVEGKVSSLCSFGAFIDLGGADGLVHVSELSWKSVRSPDEVLKVGDVVKAQVLKVDKESKKISLSLKRLSPEPWQAIAQQYHVGQLVKGTITKLVDFGAFARIEGGIEGLIHISELSQKRLQHPKEVVQEGQDVTLKILRVEPEKRRIALSLKQVEEAEALSWYAKSQNTQPESPAT